MDPLSIRYNNKVLLVVPDDIENIVIIRKEASYNITLPKDELLKKNYLALGEL